MTRYEDLREVDRFIGEHGIPSRVLHGSMTRHEAIAALADHGCGAWVGRSACGEPAVTLPSGWNWLGFAAYRAVIYGPNTPCIAVVCERHDGDHEVVVRDMPRQLRRSQDREYRKFCAKHGEAYDRSLVAYSLKEALEATAREDG